MNRTHNQSGRTLRSRALAAALLIALAAAPGSAAAAGPSTVTVPGTAASIDNPTAVNSTAAVGSGLSLAGVAGITVSADGAETPFPGWQNYSNGGAFVAEFVGSGGAPIALPAGYAADRVCDTYPAYPCTLFWPVGHTGPVGSSTNSWGTPGAHSSPTLPVPAGAVDVRYAALDSDYADNGGGYTVTTTEAASVSPRTMLSALVAASTGVGSGQSLSSKASAALAALDAGNAGAACAILSAYDHEVDAQTGKKLTAAQAAALRATTAQIASRLAC
jgi:hypothetical protein